MRTNRAPLAAFLALAIVSSAAAPAMAAHARSKTSKRAATSPAPAAAVAPDSSAVTAPSPSSSALPAGTEIKVERVRPEKESLPTLRFLRENVDFIRARFDRLREKPEEQRADAADLDPRLLDYARLLAEALAARDTVGEASDALARQHLLESIGQLGSLESRLDLMEHELEKQRIRLAHLEDDFTGRQQTALMVVLSGYPKDAPVTEVTLTLDDGVPLRVALTPEQCQSLRHGGVVELFHGFAEPREQVVQVTLGGVAMPGGDSGFVTLSPMRDRLTFLRFDLSNVQPAQGGASVRASTWLHEAGTGSIQG